MSSEIQKVIAGYYISSQANTNHNGAKVETALKDILSIGVSSHDNIIPSTIQSVSSRSDGPLHNIPLCLPDSRRSQLSPKFKEDIDWSDKDQLLKHGELFDWKERTLLESAARKQQHYQDGFEKGNYFDNIYPLIASGYQRAEQITYCGALHVGGPRPCRQWCFCSRCAFFKGCKALKMYDSAFTKSQFHHLTSSFDGSLPLDSTNSSELQIYWKAIEQAIDRAVNEGLIDGAYLVHELKLLQLLPVRVLPHSHILISGNSVDSAVVQTIAEYIREAQGVERVPSLCLKKINDKPGFRRVIQYLTKAMDLKEPYQSALIIHGQGRLRDLNVQLKETMEAISAAMVRFPRIVRMGNLMPQKSKEFIGTIVETTRTKKKKRRKATRKKRS